jgi:hypothetical protein
LASIPERRESGDSYVAQYVVILTPTALPRKNRIMQRTGKELASEANNPNSDVKNKVALNAVLRPRRSEPFQREKSVNGVLA